MVYPSVHHSKSMSLTRGRGLAEKMTKMRKGEGLLAEE